MNILIVFIIQNITSTPEENEQEKGGLLNKIENFIEKVQISTKQFLINVI